MATIYDSASLVMIPSGYKEDKVYSIKPTDGSGDLAFTRSNDTATRVGPDGLIEKVRTNLVLNSATFVTQTITVGANPHTLSFTGTGTIVITGVGSGTLVGTGVGDRVSLSLTTTAGSLILTLTGTATLAQLETGDIATPYIATEGAAVSVGPVADLPRLDYSGGASCPSLLLEPQRTNLVTYSEQFNNAAYTKLNSSITANAGISPDGFVNADKLVENTANTFHLVGQNRTLAVGLVAYSFYAKAAGRSQLRIDPATAELSPIAHTFNLDNGTSVGGFIEPAANGFFRCSGTFNVLVAGTRGVFIVLLNSSGVSGYLGDGVSGAFLWGLQYEQAVYATSYIPTLAAAVTRSADSASKTGISALIGQTEGTLFLEADIQKRNAGEVYIAISAGSVLADSVFLQQTSSDNLSLDIRRTGGPSVVLTILGANYTAGINKVAIAYTSTTAEVFINGVSKGTASFTLIPSCSKLSIGSRPDSVGLIGSGGYSQTLLFPTRLSNAQLEELTA